MRIGMAVSRWENAPVRRIGVAVALTGVIFGAGLLVPVTAAGTRTDLAVQVTDSADPVMPGTPITYTFRVTNWGPSKATDVRLAYWGSRPDSPATTTHGSCDASTCLIGALKTRGSAYVTFEVTPQFAGQWWVRGQVWGPELDVNQANNADEELTKVLGPDLEVVDFAVSADPVRVGDRFSITTTIRNTGVLASGLGHIHTYVRHSIVGPPFTNPYFGHPFQIVFVSADGVTTCEERPFELVGDGLNYWPDTERHCDFPAIAAGETATVTMWFVATQASRDDRRLYASSSIRSDGGEMSTDNNAAPAVSFAIEEPKVVG